MPITIMTGDMKYRDSLGNYHGLEGIRGETGPQGPKGDKGDTGDPAPASEVAPAVEDWLEENIVQETGYVLDRSLLANNAAAPADLVGDLKNEINDGIIKAIADLANATVVNGAVYTNGKWYASSTNYQSYLIPNDNYDYVKGTGSAGNSSFAFLNCNSVPTPTDGQSAPLCEGETTTHPITAGEASNAYPVPADCTYIAVAKKWSKNDRTPASVTLMTNTGLKTRIDKNENNISDNEEELTKLLDMPRNLLDKRLIVHGKINNTTGEVVSDSGIGHSDYIEVTPNTKYILAPQYYSSAGNIGIAFYSSEKAFISGSGMKQCYASVSSNDPYVFVVPSGAAYMRFNIADTRLDYAYMYEYSDVAAKMVFGKTGCAGEPIVIDSKISIAQIAQYSTERGRPQGGSVYDGKLFIFNDNLTSNCMLDLDSYTIHTVTLSGESVDNHANCVAFSNIFYDQNDTFPLIFISSERESYMGAYRITVSNDTYSIAEISKIYFPSNDTGNSIVDAEHNLIYIRGIPTGETDWHMTGYRLPDDLSEDVILEYEPYDSDQHPNGYVVDIPYEKRWIETGSASDQYGQDCFIRNNKFYTLGGYQGTAQLNVCSMASGKSLSFIDLTSVITEEPEVCDVYENGIVIVTYGCKVYYMKNFAY